MAVQFFSADINIPTLSKRKLKLFIRALFEQEGKLLDELSYIFCSDDYLLEINRQFLNHDYFTDIITFDISIEKVKVKGEVYLSIDRIKDNAIKFNQPFQTELLRVIFHGALHLCGYKDKTKLQKRKMREKEDYYLFMFHK